jgi:uncharacterized protein (TIGR02271 family)
MIDDPQTVLGRSVIGPDGEKIGKVEEIYLDTHSQHPEWISVTTGFFGSHRSLVPLSEAIDEGSDLRIPYSQEQVKAAPHYDPDRELSEVEEADLYRHYGMSAETQGAGTGEPGGRRDLSGEPGVEGRDVSGSTTDQAMTRSEEQLRVGTQRVETGRARLRKYIVTEEVQTTVPVSREEVRIEREPITDANRESAMAGPELSEEEHEVTLTAERPVVSKETVPVERVRVNKEQISEDQQVTEQVRKERIETDDQTGGQQR